VLRIFLAVGLLTVLVAVQIPLGARVLLLEQVSLWSNPALGPVVGPGVRGLWQGLLGQCPEAFMGLSYATVRALFFGLWVTQGVLIYAAILWPYYICLAPDERMPTFFRLFLGLLVVTLFGLMWIVPHGVILIPPAAMGFVLVINPRWKLSQIIDKLR
jgi:hypothetical protein